MILTASNLTKSFKTGTSKTIDVLHDINLSVHAGELIALVGPSGSGKSTLLNCLSGLERPTSGSVEFLGHHLESLSANELAKLRRGTIGFIFQQFNLLDSLTVEGNVRLQTRLAKRPMADADMALAAVGLKNMTHAKPDLLSGGEQQRVAIARALAVSPRILFADEPTGALDSEASATVLGLLRSRTADGGTVVMVTHNIQAAAMADRVLVLRDGHLRAELRNPTPRSVLDVLEQPDSSPLLPRPESDASSCT